MTASADASVRRSLDRRTEPYSRLVWILLAAGAVARIAQYLANRSLWTDECLLSLNLIHRSFGQLLQPLADNQAAPLGFLFAEKIMIQLFGSGEYVLRFLPLVAAVVALFLFRRLAYKLLSPTAVPFAMALFSVSDMLIYYASEVKQYSLDVLGTLAVLLAGLDVLEKQSGSKRPLLRFALIGTAALWFSHAAIFVLASTGAILAFVALRHRRTRVLLQLAAVGAFWSMNLAALYLLSFRSAAANQFLLQYWTFSFMPLPPKSLADFAWFAKTFLYAVKMPVGLTLKITNPAGFVLSIFAIAAFLIGLFNLLRQRTRSTALLLLVPIGLALLASAFKLYPFYGRLLLFICPSVLLIIAAGLAWIAEHVSSRRVWMGYACAAVLIAYPAANAAYHLAKPRQVEEARTVVAALALQVRPGDTVCLYYGGERTFEYYASRYGLAASRYVVLSHSGKTWDTDLADVDRLRGNGRVWVVISHYMDVNLGDGREVLLHHLDMIGRRMSALDVEGAGLYLYNLSSKS